MGERFSSVQSRLLAVGYSFFSGKSRAKVKLCVLFSMKKFLFSFGFLAMLAGVRAQTPRKFSFQQPKMGSLFTVQLYAIDSLVAVNAAAEAFVLADSLDARFSDYDENSELNRLSQTAGSGRWVPVSPDLFGILSQSKTAWQRSSGTFDVTVGRLTRLWRQTRKARRLSPPDTLRRALATVGMQHLQLDAVGRRVRLDKKGVRLDLGGIGKGYAAQAMFDFLEREGFPQALVDAAGNLAIGGGAWRIAVQLPAPGEQLIERQLLLQNVSVSTSGDLFQFVEIGGKRYSHIVDPRTGLGLTNRRQVTVLAANAALADWLSTACCLLSVEKALALVRRMKGDVLILQPLGGRIQARMSPGFRRFFAPE